MKASASKRRVCTESTKRGRSSQAKASTSMPSQKRSTGLSSAVSFERRSLQRRRAVARAAATDHESSTPHRCRGDRNRRAPGGGCRFGNHGGAARWRKPRHRSSRKHYRDRRNTHRPDYYVRADLRRSFQSGRDTRGRIPRWPLVAGCALVRRRPARWRVAGVFAAHLMFGEEVLQVSEHVRAGGAQMFSEFVATFGLLSVIWSTSRKRSDSVPFAVGLYITGAYWFTASTSFANPAVTIARSLTNTFAGIRPADVGGFIAAQLAGAFVATVLFRWFMPVLRRSAENMVLPHTTA